jgi:hypothetical protein
MIKCNGKKFSFLSHVSASPFSFLSVVIIYRKGSSPPPPSEHSRTPRESLAKQITHRTLRTQFAYTHFNINTTRRDTQLWPESHSSVFTEIHTMNMTNFNIGVAMKISISIYGS